MTGTSSCCRTTGSSRPTRRSWRFRRIASRCRARRRTGASARGRTASRRPARTGTSSSTSRTAKRAARADGQRSRRVGDRCRPRSERPARGRPGVHRQRREGVPDDHEARVRRRPDRCGAGGSGRRPQPRDHPDVRRSTTRSCSTASSSRRRTSTTRTTRLSDGIAGQRAGSRRRRSATPSSSRSSSRAARCRTGS